MKITIYTTTEAIDPTAEATEAQNNETLAAYESACREALTAYYPEAEIDFERSEYPYYDGEDFLVSDDADAENESVAAILESVWDLAEWR